MPVVVLVKGFHKQINTYTIDIDTIYVSYTMMG